MSMLRDDVQVALNEVVRVAEDCAQRYDYAAGLAPPGTFRRLLRELAQSHMQAAGAIAQRLRDCGSLPDVPDADRVFLEHMVIRAKTSLTGDRIGPVLAQAEAGERRLIVAVDAALGTDLSEDDRRLLERLREAAQRACVRIGRYAGEP